MAQPYSERRKHIIREEVLIRWVGSKLGFAIKSLSRFRDGSVLESLINKLSNGRFAEYQSRKENKPMTTVKKLLESKKKGSDVLLRVAQERVHCVLKYLEKQFYLPMTAQSLEMGILSGSDDILELLESLVLHYEIKIVMKFSDNTKKEFLEWVNDKLPTGFKSTNFGEDWRDGIRLAAFLNYHCSDMCSDWQTWDDENCFLNIKTAMDVIADEVLGVAPILGPSEMSYEACPDICVITYMSQFLSATMIVSRAGFHRDSTLSEQYRRESAEMYVPIGSEPVTSFTPSLRPVHENRPLPAVPALEPEYDDNENETYMDPDDVLLQSRKPCKNKSTFLRPPIPVPDSDKESNSSWNRREAAQRPTEAQTIDQNSNEVRLTPEGTRRRLAPVPSVPLSLPPPIPKPLQQPGSSSSKQRGPPPPPKPTKQSGPSPPPPPPKPTKQSGPSPPPPPPKPHKQPVPPPPPSLISRKPPRPHPPPSLSMPHKLEGQALTSSEAMTATGPDRESDDQEIYDDTDFNHCSDAGPDLQSDDTYDDGGFSPNDDAGGAEPSPPIPPRVTKDQQATEEESDQSNEEYSYVHPEKTLSNEPETNIPVTKEAEVTWPLPQYPVTDVGISIGHQAIEKPQTQYPRTTVGKETTDADGGNGPMKQCWENDAQELLTKHPDLDRIIIQTLRPPNTLELGSHEEPKQGNLADVYQARLYDQKMGLCMVAAKTMRDDGDEIHLLNEAALMMKLRHENVMCLYGLVLMDLKVYLLQPWMANGDLKTYLDNRGPSIKEQRLFVFALDIACAMEYLSDRNIVHRDLAARNCLLDRVLRVKITDFTLSRDVFIQPYIRKTDMGMPYQTAALEVLEELKYTTMSDVWSFGVVLWEILTLGAEPYFNKMSSQITSFLLKGNRLPQPDNDRHNMHELMLECWDADPNKRPTFTQVFDRVEETMVKIDPSYTSRMAMPTSGVSYLMFQAPEMPVVHTQLGTHEEDYYQLKEQK